MKIVIDIPEECVTQDTCFIEWVKAAGDKFEMTILPKGHGRLIDADALVKKMEEREEKLKDDRSMWETATVETALDMYAQTIIEADGGAE